MGVRTAAARSRWEAPQWPQNFSSASIGVPHAAQARPSRRPHSVQKRRSGRLACPQDAHGITVSASTTLLAPVALPDFVVRERAVCQRDWKGVTTRRWLNSEKEVQRRGRWLGSSTRSTLCPHRVTICQHRSSPYRDRRRLACRPAIPSRCIRCSARGRFWRGSGDVGALRRPSRPVVTTSVVGQRSAPVYSRLGRNHCPSVGWRVVCGERGTFGACSVWQSTEALIR